MQTHEFDAESYRPDSYEQESYLPDSYDTQAYSPECISSDSEDDHTLGRKVAASGQEKTAVMFAAGGALDSQTTDSQWERTLTTVTDSDQHEILRERFVYKNGQYYSEDGEPMDVRRAFSPNSPCIVPGTPTDTRVLANSESEADRTLVSYLDGVKGESAGVPVDWVATQVKDSEIMPVTVKGVPHHDGQRDDLNQQLRAFKSQIERQSVTVLMEPIQVVPSQPTSSTMDELDLPVEDQEGNKENVPPPTHTCGCALGAAKTDSLHASINQLIAAEERAATLYQEQADLHISSASLYQEQANLAREKASILTATLKFECDHSGAPSSESNREFASEGSKVDGVSVVMYKGYKARPIRKGRYIIYIHADEPTQEVIGEEEVYDSEEEEQEQEEVKKKMLGTRKRGPGEESVQDAVGNSNQSERRKRGRIMTSSEWML
ncbi:hypothetical protein QCA50_001708 [Cerrena zonata]|uniref:Uncharacterized protein n=1 Tax=Cerrena zonata TaxID=2478898 RepID=A0AAW0GPF9_9APHY